MRTRRLRGRAGTWTSTISPTSEQMVASKRSQLDSANSILAAVGETMSDDDTILIGNEELDELLIETSPIERPTEPILQPSFEDDGIEPRNVGGGLFASIAYMRIIVEAARIERLRRLGPTAP
jgi:hypothetical protein